MWLKPEFARWNIEEYLPAIQSPVLVVQGEDDEYGTPAQVDAVLRQVRGPAQSLVLPRCGHSPHATRADEVLEAASRFIREALRFGPLRRDVREWVPFTCDKGWPGRRP